MRRIGKLRWRELQEYPRRATLVRHGAFLGSSSRARFADLVRQFDADDDGKWDAAFAETGDKLEQLAERALEDFRAGRTTLLDPEKL